MFYCVYYIYLVSNINRACLFFSSEYDLFQIELSKNYGVPEWRDDIKGCMKKAGLENIPIVFLFSDTQVIIH